MMPTMQRSGLLLALILLVVGCGGPRQRPPVDLDGITLLRDYGWDMALAEPQAVWHPTSYRLLARRASGLELLDEGQQRQVVKTPDATKVVDPQWLDEERFVYGPHPFPTVGEDGRLLLPNYGLMIGRTEQGYFKHIEPLTSAGYRPRPWRYGRIVFSLNDQIRLVDWRGREEPYDRGFSPEPQPGRTGIAFQTVPLEQTDHWTGQERPGALVVRWRPGAVQTFPGGHDPVWVPGDGGLVYTLTRELTAAEADGVWRSSIMHVAGPDAQPELVHGGANQPAVHPTRDLIACRDADGRIVLTALSGGGAIRVISDSGYEPAWSFDGKRLLVREPHAGSDERSHLRVYVLQFP